MNRPTWRTRLRAAAAFLDHLLLRADALISAHLDIRPLSRSGAEFLGWLGRTWRTHLAAAHTRRHGPGRGVIAVVITHPNTTEKEPPHER